MHRAACTVWTSKGETMNACTAHIDANLNAYVDRLKDLLRIASISTDPERKTDCRRAAEWVKQLFDGCGIAADIVETAGHPAVLADSGPSDGGPTILVYGHYDVQPVGDERLWQTPAFEPALRDGALYARGAADDKGQVLTHLFAAEAWKKTTGKLPVRVKFLVEGEEEIGSPNLGKLIRDHRDRLACDYVVLSDTAKLDAKTPALTYGTKGLVYKEILITGPRQDLHSGSFGGTITNPGNALCAIIASLRDADNRVTIPGFYDDVRDMSPKEREQMRGLSFSEADYQRMTGSSALTGEKGYTTLERRWARPTLDVNGLFGGFTGKGASTIIPARMSAKVSMRLVPDQDPDRISKAFEEAVRKAAPPGVTVEFSTHGSCAAYMCPLDSPGLKAAAAAVEAGFGVKPALIREGGSLPILPMFRQVLGAESIMMGFCRPDCNAHGPNEFFYVDDLHHGTRSAAHLLQLLRDSA